MAKNSIIRGGLVKRWRDWRWLAPVVVAVALIGCATTDKAAKEPTPRDVFKEYRQLVVQASGEIANALHALDEISIQADKDPRPAYAAFAKAVHRLEVDSIRVRARADAMRARGAAYFDSWDKYLATIDNEQVRERAKKNHEELKQAFENARLASQQVREDFRPMLSDLQKLRAMLEGDLTLAHIDAAKNVILEAEDRGRKVEQGLDRVLAELNSMMALVRPPGLAPKR